jgi:hypothetical protein
VATTERRAVSRRYVLLLLNFSFLLLTFRLASIGALKFEAIKKKEESKTGVNRGGRQIEGKIMNLSIEAKVAIAVATSLVVLIVGAMAQG